MTLPPPLFQTPTLDCRIIDPDDRKALGEAARLDRDLWGNLGQDLERFTRRAENGYLIGAWHWSGLMGTISCLCRHWSPVKELGKNPEHPYATWDSFCGEGRLDTTEPDGDALFCVAVTTMDAGPRPLLAVPDSIHPALDLARLLSEKRDEKDPESRRIADALASACAESYVPKDYVVRFHGRPKGGIMEGAWIVTILRNGRPEDRDSMGYNVILAYPDWPADRPFPSSTPSDVSAGSALVLAAARLAAIKGLKVVAPYSRPAGFRRALVKTLVAIATGVGHRSEESLRHAVVQFLGEGAGTGNR